MKIMYLLFSFTIGGTERLVTDICNEMVSKNHEVYLYIVNDLYSEDLLNTVDSNVRIILQKRSIGGGAKFQTILKITRFIRENRIDVVHCNSFNSPELLFLSKIINYNTKVVHTIHDVGQYKTLNWVKCRYRSFICDRFIAISNSVKKDIITFGVDPNKVTVVYNAIDLKKFAKKEDKVYDPKHVIIGNVARINSEKKGQDILIRALTKIKNENISIECFFAGAADVSKQDDLKKLEKLAIMLEVGDNIHFLGNVNDVPEFLSKIDIFVLPSRFEGFGISLIEAMAMGIPCVASKLDGPAEIIGRNERGFLFEPNDVNDLANRLKELIKNYSVQKIKCNKNMEYVYKNFDIINMCEKLVEIYSA